MVSHVSKWCGFNHGILGGAKWISSIHSMNQPTQPRALSSDFSLLGFEGNRFHCWTDAFLFLLFFSGASLKHRPKPMNPFSGAGGSELVPRHAGGQDPPGSADESTDRRARDLESTWRFVSFLFSLPFFCFFFPPTFLVSFFFSSSTLFCFSK